MQNDNTQPASTMNSTKIYGASFAVGVFTYGLWRLKGYLFVKKTAQQLTAHAATQTPPPTEPVCTPVPVLPCEECIVLERANRALKDNLSATKFAFQHEHERAGRMLVTLNTIRRSVHNLGELQSPKRASGSD